MDRAGINKLSVWNRENQTDALVDFQCEILLSLVGISFSGEMLRDLLNQPLDWLIEMGAFGTDISQADACWDVKVPRANPSHPAITRVYI